MLKSSFSCTVSQRIAFLSLTLCSILICCSRALKPYCWISNNMKITQARRIDVARSPVRSVICGPALPKPMCFAQASTAPVTCAPGTVLQDFMSDKQWASELQAVHGFIHRQLDSGLGTLNTQPTVHSANGDLLVPSLNGDVEVRLQTHAGGPISHKVQSTMPLAKAGVLHTRTVVHACLPQGTPFLDISLIGGSRSAVLAMYMLPRVDALRNEDYRHKYYKSVPAAADPGVLPLAELVMAMCSKSDQALNSQLYKQSGSHKLFKPLYKLFSSPNLWSRIMTGYGIMVEFETQAGMIPMVEQDVAAMVDLWCAWVREDWAGGNGPALTGTLAEECKDFSRIYANFLEHDEDGDRILQMFGDQGAAKLLDTMSGKASLAEAPWWAS